MDFKKLICNSTEIWVTEKWSYSFILFWCYSKRMGKSTSSLSVLGSTAGTLNKWVLGLGLDEVGVHIMPRKFRLCVYVATVIQSSHVRHIVDMVEYLLWQQEVCLAASGLVQKKVEFNFPLRPCLPSTASSEALSLVFHCPHTPLLLGFWARALAENGTDSSTVWTTLTLDSVKLERDYKAVHRCLQTQAASRSSEELLPSYCGWCYKRDWLIHLWKNKEGHKD